MASKPYDVTVKDLLEELMPAWPPVLGPWPTPSIRVIDADLATVSAAPDKVMIVEGDGDPWLLHLEVQSSHEMRLPARINAYSALLHLRHDLPVRSIVLLLRPEAMASSLTGRYEMQFPDEDEPYNGFRYHVLPLWSQPLEPFIDSELELLPLAALTDEAANDMATTIQRIDERLSSEIDTAKANKLRTATFVLLGLRYSQDQINALFRGITDMQESSTFRWIIEQGATKEARRILNMIGTAQFGEPSETVQRQLANVATVEELEDLIARVNKVSSWGELLS